MPQKKIPLRRCNGCLEMKPKKELIRVVKAPDVLNEKGEIIAKGEISVDKTGKKSGRGAYVCSNPECLKIALKARRFEKAFSCKIPEEIYSRLKEEMQRDE